MDQLLTRAIQKCPFLGELSRRNGESYAKSIALNPTVPASANDGSVRRPILEDYDTYEATFRAFHGPRGVCPLSGHRSPLPPALDTPPAPSAVATRQPPAQPVCLRAGAAAELSGGVPELPQRIKGRSSSTAQSKCSDSAALKPECQPLHPSAAGLSSLPLSAAPFATLSLPFGRHLPDFGKMLTQALRQQPQPKPRNPRKPPGSSSKNSSSSGKGMSGSSRPKGQSSRSSTIQQKGSSNGQAGGGGGQCPLRKVLGPLSPMILNAKGNVQCPAPIIKARAMLAGTEPVRLLRPQALPAKLTAVGATSLTVNIPCGMWREHCEKFSGNWFLAVHASIPFIAMLRKAVIMPKFAILFSLATAVAGQTIGSRMERRRRAPLKPASPSSPQHCTSGAVVALAPTQVAGSFSTSNSLWSGSGSSRSDVAGRCNSAQLAALEYFSSLEGSGVDVAGNVSSSSSGVQEHAYEHEQHVGALTFRQGKGNQRVGLMSKGCKRQQGHVPLLSAPPALTIVS